MVSYTLEDASGQSPAYTYVTISEIKSYLEVDASTYDSLLSDMLYAVAEDLERETGQSLKNRTVTVEYDYNERYFLLPIRPVTSLTSVTYTASDESSGTLTEASGNFNVYGLGNRTGNQVLEFADDYNKITVTYNSDGSSVPAEFKLATMAHIKVLFNDDRDFDGSLSKVRYPESTIRLIRKYQQIEI